MPVPMGNYTVRVCCSIESAWAPRETLRYSREAGSPQGRWLAAGSEKNE
jgi:hypothetical protein